MSIFSTIARLRGKGIPIQYEQSEFFDYLSEYLNKNETIRDNDPHMLIALAEYNISKTPSYKDTKKNRVDL